MTARNFHAGVLGSPIEHSKSPDIHRAAYAVLNVPIDYERVEVTEHDADTFMASLTQRYGSTRHLAGFSVTMPLKAALVRHMREVSPRVARLGVLNTVVFDRDGIPSGYNTDVDGIIHALSSAGYVSGRNGSMGILGAGGTASAAIAAAAGMGLNDVVLYVRNPARAQDQLQVAQRFGIKAQIRLLTDFSHDVVDHSAVVTTLPTGATDWIVHELPDTGLPPLLDVIYEPWPTDLAHAWRLTGAHVASGLDMLLYQGVEQVKLFTAQVADYPHEMDWELVTERMAEALGVTPYSK